MAADLATIQRLHPEWNVTQIAMAPNGGIWAVGRDGGVFALNSEGGTEGTVAPTNTGGAFSYTGLAPEQRMGTREFTGIRATAGGYELLSNNNETYAFNLQTAPVAPTGPNTAGDTPATGDDTSGRDVFINSLVSMGFSREQATSLGTSLWTSSKTKSQDALYLDLVGSAEYAARFPGMKSLRDQGTAISEAQYVGLERSFRSAARSAGLPEGFYDSPDDFGKLIANGVSPDEYAGRIRWAQTAALSDPTFLAELQRQVPDANLGDLTAFYLDPDKGTDYLQQKTIRAQTGASAIRSGFGQLSQGELDILQSRGVSAEQAQAGFADLGGGIMANTVEESLSDNQFTREEAVGYVAEAGRGGASTAELEARRKRRAASFQGGGGAASGGGGRTGLG